ncbi:MAG: penicillin-binding transpeptidase domain-containing protein [Aggregatilineales bacterium]
MPATRALNHLAAGLLIAFTLVALSASYWAVIGPDTILRRADNPRLVEAEASIVRGQIVDRNGVLLAVSEQDADRRFPRRVYPHPEASPLIGYASQRYGVGGAEAAYNAILRGDTLPKGVWGELTNTLLHQPQRGSDIRLTLDINVQQTLADALVGQAGAAVVLAVPSGAVLGLASAPMFDANTLDADWERLRADPGRPFFNRALQGSYQPGGAVQTPLLAAGLLDGQPLETEIAGATVPVNTAGAALTCALRLPELALTLREAYGFACPEPFRQLALALGSESVQAAFDMFHFGQPPALAGFEFQAISDADAFEITDNNLEEMALGQGDIVVTPLQMAVMAAAIVNDGNAPQPYLLVETRAPGAALWEPVLQVRPTTPYATAATARQLQDLMRSAVAQGAAINAARPGLDIGGHAALALSGASTQAWFVGFATLPGLRGVAVAVVLENSRDPGLAADIGGQALAAAHRALMGGE